MILAGMPPAKTPGQITAPAPIRTSLPMMIGLVDALFYKGRTFLGVEGVHYGNQFGLGSSQTLPPMVMGALSRMTQP